MPERAAHRCAGHRNQIVERGGYPCRSVISPSGLLRGRRQGLVRGITPQGLREDGDLRRHVATQLSQVQAAVDGMLVDQPRRRIVRATPSANGVSHAVRD